MEQAFCMSLTNTSGEIVNDLTLNERSELEAQEVIIERGIGTFMEVGAALLAIRDDRLYRAEYGTFEDYCRERWGFTQQHATRLIRASEAISNIGNEPLGSLPTHESQIRPLTRLDPDGQRLAWQRAVETAPASGITAGHVQRVVDDMIRPEQGNGKHKPKTNRAGDEYIPQGFDACQTPAYALDPLLPYLRPEWVVWEPAAGEGMLVGGLYDSGFKTVVTSDILTGQNFFDYEPERWDCLITNPPYSIKYKWLERCYALNKPFALLLPVETLGAKSAQIHFREHGIEVIFLDRRINFKMPNIGWEGSAAQFPVAWFTWGLKIGQQMTFARLSDVPDH